jgi:hypothetical protein
MTGVWYHPSKARKMRYLFVAFLLLATPAAALQQQVSVVMNLPAISCGGGALAGGRFSSGGFCRWNPAQHDPDHARNHLV